MPNVPSPLRKVLREFLEDAAERAKIAMEATKQPRKILSGSYTVARKLEFVEIISKRTMNKDTVHFSENEKEHLRNGGVIVVVHACGTETHVSSPW